MPSKSGDYTYEYVLNEILKPIAEEFMPEIILMVDGSNPHFTDRITRMGLTLRGIRSIDSMIVQLASKLCEGKIVDFIGSVYSVSLQTVSWGWLALIMEATGFQTEIEEPTPIYQDINSNRG